MSGYLKEMHQGKHLEYEKRLHDTLIASLGPNATGIVNGNGASKANGNFSQATY